MSNSSESSELLARIDERLKSLDDKFTVHIKLVEKHIDDDKEEFKSIKNRVLVLTIIIVVIGTIIGGPQLIAAVIK